MNISDAIQTLIMEIKQDQSYRTGWQANIAMSFYDAFKNSTYGPDVPNDELHKIANTAANNFLSLLCQS